MTIEDILKNLKFRNDFTEVKNSANRWVKVGPEIKLEDLIGKTEVFNLVTSLKLTPQEIQRTPHVVQHLAAQAKRELKQKKRFSVLDSYDCFRDTGVKDDKNIWVFVHKETGKILRGNTLAYTFSDDLYSKNKLTELKADAPPIKFVYLPAEPYGLIDIKEDTLGFNLFKTINWDEVENIELPEEYITYFNHLFPDENQRRLVFSWAHFAEVKRLNIALILYGPKGIGKSTLVEILKNIYDKDLTVLISDGYFDNKFSGEIENKKLAIIEEVTCRGMKAKSKLKAMMNDFITIERKGENPRSNVQSFCNFIMTTNYAHSIEVEPDDRRFFVPDLAKEKIPAKIISVVVKGMTDLKTLKAIRKYFSENLSEDFDWNVPYKNTNAYWEMVRESANDSIDFILTELEKTKGQESSYLELRATWDRTPNKIKGRFIQRAQLLKFLEAYKPFGKQYVTWDAKGQLFKIEEESKEETKPLEPAAKVKGWDEL